MRVRVVTVVMLALTVGACAEQPGTSAERAAAPAPSTHAATSAPKAPTDLDAPPDVELRVGSRDVALRPFTYCYQAACVDGIPQPHDIGAASHVEISYALPDWSFTAVFTVAEQECARRQDVALRRTGSGAWSLGPAGHAGWYDVTLSARGPGGDAFYAFRWTTLTDGPMAEPAVRLALLADNRGRVDSYGIELELSNLAATPRTARAAVTVHAANGRSRTFEATRSTNPCWPEGTVYWDGPVAEGKAAARLGAGPFTYDVAVTLDGVRYEAAAHWPADQIAGNEPSVALDFSPPLPAPR